MDIVLLFLLFHAFFLLGNKIHSGFGLSFSAPLEKLTFCTALGLIAISCATTLLAFFGLIYPSTIWAILIITHLSGIQKTFQLARFLFCQAQSLRLQNILRIHWFDAFNACVLSILLFCALTLALTPPTRTDTLVYHLAIPKAYLANNGIVNLPNNIYSFFPLQMEMLFLFCLALKGEVLAQLAGLGVLALLLSAMILYFRRNISEKFSSLVPVLFFSTPTFFEGAITAYVDVAAASFIFFAYYSWDKMREESAWVFPLALFAGSALGTKLTAGIILPIAVIGVLLHKQNLRAGLKPVLILLITAFIFLLPWWTKNQLYAGNPFMPLFMPVFGGEENINWDSSRAQQFDQFVRSFGMGRGIKDFFLLPIHLTFLSEKSGFRFDGQLGVVYCILLPGLLFLGRGITNSRKHILHLAIIFSVLLIFWFLNFQYIRFLASPFTFLTLILTYGFKQMTESGLWVKRCASALLAIAIAYNTNLILTDWEKAKPWPYLLGQESREQYLERRIPSFPIYQAMNRSLGVDDVALFVYMRNLGYLCEKKFISDSLFEAHTLQAILSRDMTIEGIFQQMRQRRITHLMFDNDFVFGNNSAFTPLQLEALKYFINARTRLIEGKNGYYLYRLVVD